MEKEFTTIRTMLRLKPGKTLSYHPQTNDQTERYNQMVVHRLRVFFHEHQRDWDTLIQPFTYAHNAKFQRKTGPKHFSLALTRTRGTQHCTSTTTVQKLLQQRRSSRKGTSLNGQDSSSSWWPKGLISNKRDTRKILTTESISP